MLKKDPEIAVRREKIEQDMQAWIQNDKKNPNSKRALNLIPVVVHVVYTSAADSIPAVYIQQQLDILNEDYSKTNPDWATVTPAVFQPNSANCEIFFCMAAVDPSGNPTTGIIYKKTTTPSFSGNDDVKFNASGGSSGWPSNLYLNLWICNLDNPILGYATPPGGPAANDGVVLLNSTLPGPPANSKYGAGRTATHEVGHWLNLEHINGDASCGNDLVGDTPKQDALHYNVPIHPLHADACGAGSSPNGEMFMNYMDYGDDVTLVMFTNGQKQRMQACISTARGSLYGSAIANCTPGTEVHDLLSSEHISIFPNPTTGNFSLVLALPNISTADMTIYNAIGDAVVSDKVSFTSGNAVDVNMHNKPDGMYFIKLKTTAGTITKKVVINR